MRIKYSYIFSVILLFFSTALGQQAKAESSPGTTKQSEQTDIRIINLKQQATEMYETLKSGDFEKLGDLTYPKLIENAGSRENFIVLMRKALQMANETFESFTWTIGDPDKIVEVDGYLFGVVPRTLSGTSRQKNKSVQEGATVGISTDNGKTWKFINGPQFNNLFPAYADKIQIPEQVTFINGIKQ